MKSAAVAFISQEVVEREWNALNYIGKPDIFKANEEYAEFEKVIKSSGAEVHHFPLDRSVSMDSLYCRDASIATDRGMILCNMGKGTRKNEPEAQRKSFEINKIRILGSILPPATVEGGDVAWLDSTTLAVGHTYRTNEEGIRQLKALVEPGGVNLLVAQLPHYKGPGDVFHLMSIFSPVDHNLAVVFSPLMPVIFRNELLSRGFELVEVPEDEFESMACNVLALSARSCVMVSGNPETKAALTNKGCVVLEYAGTNISVKGGGGPTCLTRPIIREV